MVSYAATRRKIAERVFVSDVQSHSREYYAVMVRWYGSSDLVVEIGSTPLP